MGLTASPIHTTACTDSQCRLHDPHHRLRELRYRLHDSGYRLHDPHHRLHDLRYRLRELTGRLRGGCPTSGLHRRRGAWKSAVFQGCGLHVPWVFRQGARKRWRKSRKRSPNRASDNFNRASGTPNHASTRPNRASTRPNRASGTPYQARDFIDYWADGPRAMPHPPQQGSCHRLAFAHQTTSNATRNRQSRFDPACLSGVSPPAMPQPPQQEKAGAPWREPGLEGDVQKKNAMNQR